jgi:hypothetical protein
MGLSILGVVVVVALAAILVWSSASVRPSTTASSTTTSPVATTVLLSAPAATVAQDGQYLADVTQVDPALGTYEKKSGNVALRSLLTDGSAFCAFLQRDRAIDSAMVSVAIGARSTEPQTDLPMSVTTFNSIEAVALLTLCPSLESLVPSTDLAKIHQLGATLSDAG